MILTSRAVSSARIYPRQALVARGPSSVVGRATAQTRVAEKAKRRNKPFDAIAYDDDSAVVAIVRSEWNRRQR